jgi:integrase
LKALANRFLDEYAAKRLKPGTFADVERYLRRHWAPLLELPVRRVTRADVAAHLTKLAKDSGGYAANRARAALSALFTWAIGEGLIEANPVVGTNKPADEVARDRVLTDEELAAVWGTARPGDYASIVRLLVLTGQRREEIGGMLWSEIDTERAVWRIVAERTKNGLAHDVPLSAPALAVLAAVERREVACCRFRGRAVKLIRSSFRTQPG